ncbi:DUF4148 domain-containing protein [Trinickia violacea]|uniref:DUF4148 domain-containing protein n=1 Tax=Trinickia violacea TaxID=2571746 RepID=A0A4P8ILN4_9BURK|nr:DUF4148 domain-containing protein [Trinickia violacea]QCP49186.1 DUF4148 domain-containing protein [Trinickia violacea]
MKSLIKAVAVALVLAAPVASFAQSNQPVTRAQVRADLVQVEKAGYSIGGDKTTYPERIQAAESRVASENSVAQANTSGFGSEASATSQSGLRSKTASSYSAPISVYQHP